MSRWGPYFFPAFVLVVIAWVCLGTAVVISRALHDRRQRTLLKAKKYLRFAVSRSRESGDDHLLHSLLADVPSKVIEDFAANSSTLQWQAEVLSRYLVERNGEGHLVQAASDRHVWRRRNRIAALRILTLAGSEVALTLLDEALRDRDRVVVDAAVAALGMIRNESAAHLLVDALRARLYSPSRIATQLDRFSKPISDLLIPLLRHPIPIVRFWGATLLARYRGNPKVNAALVLLRDDPHPSVRKAVVETMGRVGGFLSAETAAALLDDPVWFVRAHAARALGNLNRLDYANKVTPLLADSEWWVRTAAKEALEAMGPGITEDLLPSLTSDDAFARNGAAEVLQALGVLDGLIAETVRTATNQTERVDLIGQILAAGGPDLVRSSVSRASPDVAAAAKRLIKKAARRHGVQG